MEEGRKGSNVQGRQRPAWSRRRPPLPRPQLGAAMAFTEGDGRDPPLRRLLVSRGGGERRGQGGDQQRRASSCDHGGFLDAPLPPPNHKRGSGLLYWSRASRTSRAAPGEQWSGQLRREQGDHRSRSAAAGASPAGCSRCGHVFSLVQSSSMVSSAGSIWDKNPSFLQLLLFTDY